MRASDIVLYSLGLSAIAGLVYWVYKDTMVPPREPTPEEIHMRFEEYLAQKEWYAEDGLSI